MPVESVSRMSGSLRRIRAGPQAVDDTQHAVQLARSGTAQGIEAFRPVAALGSSLAVTVADQLTALQAIEHGVQHAERQRMPVRLDLLLDRQGIGLPST